MSAKGYPNRFRNDREKRRDKKVITEGPKILSNDIIYFRTMIIGGPIKTLCSKQHSTAQDARPYILTLKGFGD